MRTKLFLRTLEFYWQEGHTAHATEKESVEETARMLNVYADFAIKEAAVPVITGMKSESEKFAGAVHTYSLEAMMGDTKALQAGTSHLLGQKFAKAFDIKFLDENNQLQYCWTTSWGLSTRFIGAIIMTHGDDQGLVLPPNLAPYQVVIIPIFRQDKEKSLVMEAVESLEAQLSNFRLKVDDREGLTPGFKFNDWELKGVPLRIEIGPKDVQNGTVVFSRRDIPGKEGKTVIPLEGITQSVTDMLHAIQDNMLDKATKFRDDHIFETTDYESFKTVVAEKGWAYCWWSDDRENEAQIKEETKATLRCFSSETDLGEGTCFYSGRKTTTKAYFARSY
jgi:prolyl-tRNA synthetase